LTDGLLTVDRYQLRNREGKAYASALPMKRKAKPIPDAMKAKPMPGTHEKELI
jgi:hypothetical protein